MHRYMTVIYAGSLFADAAPQYLHDGADVKSSPVIIKSKVHISARKETVAPIIIFPRLRSVSVIILSVHALVFDPDFGFEIDL